MLTRGARQLRPLPHPFIENKTVALLSEHPPYHPLNGTPKEEAARIGGRNGFASRGHVENNRLELSGIFQAAVGEGKKKISIK